MLGKPSNFPTTSLTPRSIELLQEWQRRQAMADHLNPWAESCGFIPARHHRLINATLEAVERGELRRVMFKAPPSSAKSTYITVLFPPHFLQRRPGSSVLC